MMMMKRGDNYVKTAAPLTSPALVVASRKPSGGGASAVSSSPSPNSPSSVGSASKKPSPGRTKVLKFSEDEISVATDDNQEEDARSSSTPKPKRESMLARPLPELPLVSE